MLSFFKTIISLPSFFSLRATHHTSQSTKGIREIFFIFLVQNRFVSNPASPAFFFPFIPIAVVKYSICSISLYTSHIVNLFSIFPLILPYKHVMVAGNTTWQFWSQKMGIQNLTLPISSLLP